MIWEHRFSKPRVGFTAGGHLRPSAPDSSESPVEKFLGPSFPSCPTVGRLVFVYFAYFMVKIPPMRSILRHACLRLALVVSTTALPAAAQLTTRRWTVGGVTREAMV